MGLLFVLKRDNERLAAAEAKAAVHGWRWWERDEKGHDGVVHFPRARKPPKELALTRTVVKVLETCEPDEIEDVLAEVKWDRHLAGKSFKLELTRRGGPRKSLKRLAEIIWKAQKKPDVNLLYPDEIVDVLLTEERAFIGLRVKEYTGDFAERRAHLLPAPHPTGMHPTLARALVNLADAGSIHDPFCGAGGFLIEAGLAGKRISGGDIKPEMVKRARQNLAAFGFKPDIRVADALDWLPRCQAVVTDLPYGKGTKPVDLESLLEAFLEHARTATNRIVLGLPHELEKHEGWKVWAHFEQYAHKSLTRHFYVLETTSP